MAKELGVWKDYFRTWVRGAVIEGDFDPTAWIAWFNKNYANNGYAYLGPFNAKLASLVLIVSDLQEHELENRWQSFLKTEQLDYREINNFRLEHIPGECSSREINNLLLVGNAGGFLGSLLGFGAYDAVVSGVLASKAIIEGSSYEEKVAFHKRKAHNDYVIRKRLNKMTNNGYNIALNPLKIELLSDLIYKSNINVLDLLAKIL